MLSSYLKTSSKLLLEASEVVTTVPISSKSLMGFSCIHQEQTNWCWAATTEGIYEYYGGSITQCIIVNAMLELTVCCSEGSSSACNVGNILANVLSRYNVQESYTTSKASFLNIVSEIDDSTPPCMRIGWDGGGGHFCTIFGYDRFLNNIFLCDPWHGISVQNYSTFPTAYHGGGTWTHTYYTKHF